MHEISNRAEEQVEKLLEFSIALSEEWQPLHKSYSYQITVHVFYSIRKLFFAQYWNFLNFFMIPVSKLSKHWGSNIFLNSNALNMHVSGKWKALCTPEIMINLSK